MDQPQSDFILSNSAVVLAALLCAAVCAVALIVAARCTSRFSSHQRAAAALPAVDAGLRKKAIDSLPKLTYRGEKAADPDIEKAQSAAPVEAGAECVICLSEFDDGDEIRVLPHCNHVFHVECVDKWLRSHSTCPSCRQILAGGRRRWSDIRVEAPIVVGYLP